MADLILPSAATQNEVRVTALICRNDLSGQGIGKYSIYIDRVAEPQDADGNQVSGHVTLKAVELPVAAIAHEEYTVNGVSLSVLDILNFVNEVVDAHKGDNLS